MKRPRPRPPTASAFISNEATARFGHRLFRRTSFELTSVAEKADLSRYADRRMSGEEVPAFHVSRHRHNSKCSQVHFGITRQSPVLNALSMGDC